MGLRDSRVFGSEHAEFKFKAVFWCICGFGVLRSVGCGVDSFQNTGYGVSGIRVQILGYWGIGFRSLVC